MRKREWSPARTVIVAVVALTYLAPLLVILAVSVRPTHDFLVDPLGFPTKLTSIHYSEAWTNASMGQGMINSAVVAVVSVVTLIAVSAPAAFWFTRHRGIISRAVLVIILGSWIFPFAVYVLPLFVSLSNWGLTNNLYVLGVTYAATTAPIALYLHYGYYQRIPAELTEAAIVDGASTAQLFFRLFLPLSVPIMITIAVLDFIWTWGDLLLGLVLIQSPSKYPVTVGIAELTQRYQLNTQQNAAAAVIILLPVILVFIFFQRALARGLTFGVDG